MHPTRVLLPLVVTNFVALMAVGLGYLGPAGLTSPSELAFAVAALAEELGLVALLLGGVTALVTLASPRAGRLVAALAFTLTLGALFIDVRIFALFRFHVNGLVWNVITTPGGFESAHIGNADVTLALVGLAVVLAAELGGLTWLSRRPAGAPQRRRWVAFVAFVLVAGLAERVAFAAADIVDYVPVLRASRAVPFYQWITVKREFQAYGWIHADDEPTAAAPEAGTGLRYPRAPLVTHRPTELPSILFVVVDSLREDFLTPALMPRLTRFALGSEHWRAARSGGNSTRFGIFSLFYGIYGSYWHAFLGERRPPVLLDRVRELGYRTAALASAPLTSPEFRQTVFAAGADVMVDGLPGATWEKDARLVDELRSFLAGTEPGRPWLAFVFFDSSHSGGTVPPAYARRAAEASANYLTLPDGALDQRSRRRYEGALTFLDEVTERLLAVAAERDPGFAHTFVLVTGDHGQEFGEHGFHGHNSAFDAEQTRVPLIVRQPGFAPAVHDELISHLDVVPTLGGLLGIDNPPGDYSQGVPLRTSGPRPPLVSCGWDECGLVDERGVVVFGTATHRSGKFELRDGDYRLLEATTLDPARRSRMTEVMAGLSAFVR